MRNIEIIGTSHIAKESVSETKEKILKEKPDIVCIELDKSRFISLFQKNQRKLGIKDLRVGGFGVIFLLVGRWLQKKLGDQVGIIPGADMKSAILAARKVKAKIYLIDIPIQKTLSKLSTDVSGWEKVKLILHLIFSPLSVKSRKFAKQIDLTKVPSDKIIYQAISEMRKTFPQLFKVLLDDRNAHMIKQLKSISKKYPESKIIAVIGAGHEKDIKKSLKNYISK